MPCPVPTRAEAAPTILEAHETLMKFDPRNVPKFKDVVEFLREDLGQPRQQELESSRFCYTGPAASRPLLLILQTHVRAILLRLRERYAPLAWYLLAIGLSSGHRAVLYIRQEARASVRLQAQVQQEFVALQQEKKIIYDFLHDLGEAFTEEIDREHLLRIIVTCARKVTGAKGAAIYLWDADREKLIAAIVSGIVSARAEGRQHRGRPTGRSAGKLAKPSCGWRPSRRDSTSVIAQVAQTGQGCPCASGTELDERFPWFRQKALQTETYIAVPLHYREEQLGVLALANREEGKPFTKADFDLVKSVADQAAYSLQHAQIYSQLTEKKKLDHDIEVAREIQRILLPSKAPEVAGFNCAALNIPAQQVSGDYFDFIPVDETALGRGRGRCQRQGHPGLDHHGHVPQRPAQQGARQSLARRKCCGRSTGSSIPTSARTCSSP